MKKLKELMDEIESEKIGWYDWEKYDEIFPWFQIARAAYEGSLDAAASLHERIVPDWNWELFKNEGAILSKSYMANIFIDHKNVPRAWLLAILKAYQTSYDPSYEMGVPGLSAIHAVPLIEDNTGVMTDGLLKNL